ncbi:MAG: Ig-like domain-containing protein [Bacilli bacterium]|jgi:hypothetical protein
MKKLLFLLFILIALSGCGRAEPDIFFTPDSVNALKIGETHKISYSLQGIKNLKTNLTWTSSDTSIAVVTQEGVVKGVSTGNVVITLYYNNNKDVKATRNITIVNLFINSPFITFEPGMQTYLTTRTNFSSNLLAWESSNTSVATITNNGFLSCLSAGITTIKVYYTDNPSYYDAIDLTVIPTTPTLIIDGAYDIFVNQTISLNASPNPYYDATIYWESLTPDKATITSRGEVTALSLGKAVIQASIEGFESVAFVEINIIERIDYSSFSQVEQLYQQQLYEKPNKYYVFVYDSGKDNSLIENTIIDYLNLRNDYLNISDYLKLYAFNINNTRNVICLSDSFSSDNTAWRTNFDDLKIPLNELPLIFKVEKGEITQSAKTKNNVLKLLINTMENADYENVVYHLPENYSHFTVNDFLDSHLRVITTNETSSSGSLKSTSRFALINKSRNSATPYTGSSSLAVSSLTDRIAYFNNSLSLISNFSLTSTHNKSFLPKEVFVDINYLDEASLNKSLTYKKTLMSTPTDTSIFGNDDFLTNYFSISIDIIERETANQEYILSYDIGVLSVNIVNKLASYALDLQVWVDTKDFGLLPVVGVYNYSDNTRNLDFQAYTPIYSYFEPTFLYVTCSYIVDSTVNTLNYKKPITN